MTHTYTISGMTCAGCEAKVEHYLTAVPGITSAQVSKDLQSATIAMDTHISLSELQQALGGPESKYQITASNPIETIETAPSWFETYKPILLIFSFITLTTLLLQSQNETFNLMQWMRHFMAGFFLVFSFFKFLNLKGFAESYAMYDVVAAKIPTWGYIYAFVELGLGLANLINYSPLATNITAFAVMGISIIGVLQSVLNKRKIQCACLGAVFNLPMSTVTIIEDALMIAMSGYMLFALA